MPDWLSDAVARLGADPWLQGALAALATFILEDPTTIGCGLLVADGRMSAATAFIGVATGIALGDVGLYLIGRVSGARIVERGWVDASRIERASIWFRGNLVSAVLLSRFVPGTRLPTYLGAGVLRAPFHRFVLVVVGATIVWTGLLLWITSSLGHAILPILGRARWPLALAAIVFFVLLQRRAARKLADPDAGERPVVSAFEFWPPWLFYIPVAFYYLWLAVRFRGAMLPAAANPSIYSGGLIGESKSEILDLVPDSQREWVANYVVFERPATVEQAERKIREAGLEYPLVAKPDVGQRGDGVRPVRDREDLSAYVNDFPPGARIMFQTLVDEKSVDADSVHEAGVLYWRMPGSEQGHIFSITLKQMPRIVGDGRKTVRELIAADPRARRVPTVYLERHAEVADRILTDGETLPLVFAGNHCQGAIFRDGTDLATPRLLERVHEIARAMPEFYFGRFDVRFGTLEGFLAGTDFRIIEINGAGGEATHIWDASIRLPEAYATLFEQFRILFEIGAANRRRGHKPLGIREFLREARAYRRLARSYPTTR